MTTLALDLGQNIGWIKGGTVGPLEHGTILLPTAPALGPWLLEAGNKLHPLMRGVDDIAVEQPFLSPGGKKKDGSSRPGGYYPARKLLALLGLVYMYAAVNGIASANVNEIPVSTGKKTLAGRGNAEAPEMIAACCEFWGFEPHEIDEHQAHASGIMKVHLFGEAPGPAKKSRSSKGVSILRGPAL